MNFRFMCVQLAMKNSHFNHNRLKREEDKIWIKIYKILLSSGNGGEPRRRSASHWVKIYGFACPG